VINPLFKIRQWQDSLLKWSEFAANGYIFRRYWITKLGSEANGQNSSGWSYKWRVSTRTIITNTSGSPDAARSVINTLF